MRWPWGPRPAWRAAGALVALVMVVIGLMVVRGGGSSAPSSRPPAAGHEGISGRASTAVGGRGVHTLHGACITGYDLEVDGRSGDAGHFSLTLMLASVVTSPEDLAARLSEKDCAAESAAAIAAATRSSRAAGSAPSATPAVDPGHLSVWYVGPSGGRLSVP